MGDSPESSGGSAPKSEQTVSRTAGASGKPPSKTNPSAKGPPKAPLKLGIVEYFQRKQTSATSSSKTPAPPQEGASESGSSAASTSTQGAASSVVSAVELTKRQRKNLKKRENKRNQNPGNSSQTIEVTSSKKRPIDEANLGKTGETPEDKAQKSSENDVDMSDSGTEEVAEALSKTALKPLSQEEEEEILREEDSLENEEEEPATKKPSYSKAAKKLSGVLKYVHSGTDERLAVTLEQFQTLWNRIEMELALNVAVGKPEPKIRWKSFRKDRGLILFEDEESAKMVGEQIVRIKVKSTSFRLWDREERSLKLVRGPLPDFARDLSKEQLSNLLIIRNTLPGKILEIRKIEPAKSNDGKPTKTKPSTIGMSGWSVSISCDEELWEALLARSLKAKGRQVDLKVGISRPSTFSLQVKKAGTGETEANAKESKAPAKNTEANK